MNAIVESKPTNVAELPASEAAQGIAPMVQMVASGQITIEQLDHLMGLQERHEANEAKRQYNSAMSHFRSEVPSALRDGQGQNSKYATLGSVMNAINEPLGNNGFNVDFKHSQDIEKNTLTVSCTITHAGGHSESTELTVKIEKLGSANAVQSLGGNVSYLKRYTVSSLTGLATEDNDGASMPPAQAAPAKNISDKQAGVIEDMLTKLEDLQEGFRERWKNHYAAYWSEIEAPPYLAIPVSEHGPALAQLTKKLKQLEADQTGEQE